MDKPLPRVSKRSVLRAGLAGLAGSMLPGSGSIAEPRATAPRLSRGIGVHHMLNWPEVSGGADAPVYRWPPFEDAAHQMSRAEMQQLRAFGFDFVRLTVDPAIFLAMQDARFDGLVAVVRDRVQQFQQAGLAVIFDLHPVAQDARFKPAVLVDAAKPEVFALYVDLVTRLARSFNDMPHDRFVFELFNEPPLYKPEDLVRWQAMMEHLHAAARGVAPHLPLLLTGANWGDIRMLPKLDVSPFRGSNVFYTFHYYVPVAFTHQGVENVYTQHVRDLRWPPQPGSLPNVTARSNAALAADHRFNDLQRAGTQAQLTKTLNEYYATNYGPRQVEDDIGGIARWASDHGIAANRIVLGEFGAVRRADQTPEQLSDRHAWLQTVRHSAEKEGFPWALWLYRGYGGMAVADGKAPDGLYKDDLRALGLKA